MMPDRGVAMVAIALWLAILATVSFAQQPVAQSEYSSRRAATRAQMHSRSVAVFRSAPQYPRTASSGYLYRQANSMLYLTGCTEEKIVLVLFSSPVVVDDRGVTEILFVPSRNPASELWNGARMGPVEAAAELGITALPIDSLSGVLTRVFATTDTVYYDWITEHVSDALPLPKKEIAHEEDSLLHASFPSVAAVLPTGVLTDSLRLTKSAAELAMMQTAINVSCSGHKAAMHAAHSGMHEYELAAIFDQQIEAGGAEGLAYPDIVGSGPNACTLHYESNQREIKPGELVLMDCGGEYHGYAADITRTFPVDGKFSPEQRTIYELVLRAQEAGIGEVKPGVIFRAPHNRAFAVIAQGLTALGIIGSDSLAKKYFPHGTSHTLGLDVHDTRSGPVLTQGMVITVEPGIYIPQGSPCDPKWWNIGVRIEDDVLVTENGASVLSACVPKTVVEVESAMRK